MSPTDAERRRCSICSLEEGHPGVTIGADGVCNLCKLEISGEMLSAYTYTKAVYDEFVASGPAKDSEFDCMLMYSGGKDSTYMLDHFATEHTKRILAYTFDVPFESVAAARNIELARERIPATFMVDSADREIKDVMRRVFTRPRPPGPAQYLDEKLPCVSCRSFFVIRAIVKAYELRIPYILMCADPQQILTMESNVREVVREFCRVFGMAYVESLFGDVAREILFAEDERLPKIVFPFVDQRHSYDPDFIVAALKAKGLYQSSPMETHCTLFPLLNYYSFQNYNCMFYKLNAASQQRNHKRTGDRGRATFSIKFPAGLKLTETEGRLKDVVFALAEGRGDPREHRRELESIFLAMGVDEGGARFVAESFLDMRAVAADLGVPLG